MESYIGKKQLGAKSMTEFGELLLQVILSCLFGKRIEDVRTRKRVKTIAHCKKCVENHPNFCVPE